jgi:RNA polymerase sigma factor (sigma-70 family)
MSGDDEGGGGGPPKRTKAQENALVSRAMALVEGRVKSVMRMFPGLLADADAYSAAGFAVAQVVRGYDEVKDPSYEAYARVRIDGALLDLVRSASQAKKILRAVWAGGGAVQAHHREGYNIITDRDDRLRELGLGFAEDLAAAGFAGGVAARSRESPEEQAAQAAYVDAVEMLREAFGKLSADELLVAQAVFYDGMKLVDIEQELGIPYITVRRRFERAVTKLKKALIKLGLRRAPRAAWDVPGLAPVLRSVKGEADAGSGSGGGGSGQRSGKPGGGR